MTVYQQGGGASIPYHGTIRSQIGGLNTEWDGGIDEMNAVLDATNPQRVINAGGSYDAAAKKFLHAAGVLRAQQSALAGVWKGDDADATIKQMKRLETSAQNMQQVSDKTGKALTDHGQKLDWYVKNRPGKGFIGNISYDDAGVVAAGTVVAGPAGGAIALGGKKLGEAFGLIDSAEKKAAEQHMKKLSARTMEANDNFPPDISTELPQTQVTERLPKNDYPGGPGGQVPGAGGGGGGKIPGGGIPGGGGGNIPGGGGGGNIPGGGIPGGNIPGGGGTIPGGGGGLPGGGGSIPGGGSDLAGLPGPGGGGGGSLDPFGRGLGGGLPGGGGGSIPGGGGGLPGGGPGGLAGGVPGGGLGSGPGKGGLGGGAGAGKPGAGGRGMMGGAPMSGRGGGGGGEDEHERSTWLMEDEDVWGGNDDDTAPPVIG